MAKKTILVVKKLVTQCFQTKSAKSSKIWKKEMARVLHWSVRPASKNYMLYITPRATPKKILSEIYGGGVPSEKFTFYFFYTHFESFLIC